MPARSALNLLTPAPAFEALKDGVDALFVVGDPLTFTNRALIIALTQDAKLPTTFVIREFVLAGGLSAGVMGAGRSHGSIDSSTPLPLTRRLLSFAFKFQERFAGAVGDDFTRSLRATGVNAPLVP